MIERARTLAFAAAPTYRVAGRAVRREAGVVAAVAPQRAGRRDDRGPRCGRVGRPRGELGRRAAIADVRVAKDVPERACIFGGENALPVPISRDEGPEESQD